jgi:hypothetical protein
MLSADRDIVRVAAPTDRRPDFIAEALSPRFRIGLLLATLSADIGLIFAVMSVAVSPGFLFSSGLFGTLLVAGTLVMTFVVFLVFGALVGNNPRLSTRARITWYSLFALFGPVMIPCYWLMHVWPARYEPVD